MAMMVPSPELAPPKPPRKHRAVKPPLFTRDVLDGRTSVAKAFDGLVRDIYADLGGRDQLSRIEIALVEGFAGACVVLDQLNARLLQDQRIDLSEFAQASNAMVRIASRLGLKRRAREVPSLAEYLEQREHERADVVDDQQLEAGKDDELP
jgi:hypothetical protein